MRIGKACAIFLNIGSKDYSVEEKGAAIQMVCDMPTHNGITKDRMLDVIRWLLNLLYVTGVKTEYSNADRIRAMSDEELGEFLNRVKEPCDCCQLAVVEGACTETLCDDAMMKWLQQPALSGEGSAGYRNRTHGRWREKILVGGFAEEWGFVCSECGCTVSDRSNLGVGRHASNNQRLNYCPNCGAKMDGDGDG